MTPEYEVEFLVVGGGPVGTALALDLCRAGREVLLIDAGASPGKVCGEGLLPPGWEALEALGVVPFIEEKAAIRELTYQSVCPGDGRLRSITARIHRRSYGVRREVLCRAFAQAAEQSGLQVWRPARFRSFEASSERLQVEVSCSGERRLVGCRYLLGADGLHSSVRREAGLASPRPRKFSRWGTRIYLRGPSREGVTVTIGEGVECYQTPLAPDLSGLAFIWYPEQLGRPLPGDGPTWARLLRRLGPALRETLPAESAFFGSEKAIGPLQQQVLSPLHPGGRIALLGDAGGYFDALTGEGLCLGLLQAKALSGLLLRQRLGEYPRLYRAIKRRHHLAVNVLLRLFAHPALRERVFVGLDAAPEMLQALVEVAVEHRPWHRLLVRDAFRFLLGLAGYPIGRGQGSARSLGGNPDRG